MQKHLQMFREQDVYLNTCRILLQNTQSKKFKQHTLVVITSVLASINVCLQTKMNFGLHNELKRGILIVIWRDSTLLSSFNVFLKIISGVLKVFLKTFNIFCGNPTTIKIYFGLYLHNDFKNDFFTQVVLNSYFLSFKF